MSHTPEPWEARPADSWGSFRIYPAEIWLGAWCSSLSKGEPEANARRIVACVNACAGIENPGEAIDRAKDAFYNIALANEFEDGPEKQRVISKIATETLAMLKGGAE